MFFSVRYFITAITLGLFLLPGLAQKHSAPNILWIVSEDNSPFLGCYGDSLADTPNLDKLASEGHLYTHAYANAPVCAPARNTIITGVYANSNGNQHMRSNYPLSDQVRFFPEYLKALGYYCTNNSKKDYNTSTPDNVWDASSPNAHYKNRSEGQPFFHVYNTSITHESSLHKKVSGGELQHRPGDMLLPPYHPDTKEVRNDWAHYYDRVSMMDARVGEILAELEARGDADNTIVFYFSDHGGVLARSKRYVYESGTHVPFIVRIPDAFERFRPSDPGIPVDRLISFVDLAPTMLSLTGQEKTAYMQGSAFLGEKVGDARGFVHMFRDRMDERYDLSRSTRNGRYRYIRNYLPHKIYGQYLAYLWKAANVRSWEEACQRGDCNEVQEAFWQPKPAEELYDTANDPWEVNNLANDPAYAELLKEMRMANRQWMLDVKDTGIIPEQMLLNRISEKQTSSYDYMRSEASDPEDIIRIAEMASDTEVRDPAVFLGYLASPEAAIRYWAMVGLRMRYQLLERDDMEQLSPLVDDEHLDVVVITSETLYLAGKKDLATMAIKRVLKRTDQPFARTRALNLISNFAIHDPEIQELVAKTYQQSYEKNRFRYDLIASEVLMDQWGYDDAPDH